MRLTALLRTATLLAIAAASHSAWADRDALWKIIDTQCVPEAIAGQKPAPCSRVQMTPDRDHGWVVLKDRKGVLQYLLMPTARIGGMESPEPERPDAPNYFAQAWRARDLLDQLNGSPVPRDVLSLTINSQKRRSQDQLHIHISCTQREMRARLLAAQDEIGSGWAPLPGNWVGHVWFVRRVETETLDGFNLFADVADHVPGASRDISQVTIGAVAANFSNGKNGFVLMASIFNPADPSSGSSEDDIQDHSCAIIRPAAAAAAAPATTPAP